MNMHIETPRLIIRAILPEDLEGMFAMDSDPEVHRYLGNQPYTDIAQSRENIEIIRQQYKDNGIGRWAMLLKESGEFVGWMGFKQMREMVNGHIDHYDFGYRLARKHWGKGLASEGALAALNYGIDVLALKDIYAMTDVNNAASRHILESLGFRLVEVFAYDAPSALHTFHGEPTTWYELVDARLSVGLGQEATL